ncbi:MAG: hypothetical protein IJ366_07705 [Clostridia bacterium]|nr:hypothetical protein [Clostridia bacterium]
MAKEAIEQVKLAEEQAARLVADAEIEAAEMVALAGKTANDELDAEKKKAADAILKAKADFKAAELESLTAANAQIEQKCTIRREEMLAKKEIIISRITDAIRE